MNHFDMCLDTVEYVARGYVQSKQVSTVKKFYGRQPNICVTFFFYFT